MAIEIVEMTPADHAEALALWQTCEGIYVGSLDDFEPICAYLERNPGLSFIIRDNGTLVAAALCGTDGRRGYLRHLAVAHSHRQRGLGRQLADRCLQALAQAGLAGCNIYVYADNEAGRLFWQRLGWAAHENWLAMSRQTDA